MTGAVARRAAGDLPLAPGIAGQLQGVLLQARRRGKALEHCGIPHGFGGIELPAHALQVGDSPAHLGGGQLDAHLIPGLQQQAFGLHQALPHRPVGGLAEIAPLGVLEMSPAGHQRDAHIGDGAAGEHPQMLLFGQMGHHQPLPVFVQLILGAVGGKLQPAARGTRLQQQVHFGVVAQGLEMADALHRVGDGLFVEDAPRPEAHRQPEPLPDQPLEHIQLHLAHHLQLNLLQGLVPDNVQLGVFLFQLAQLHQGGVDVGLRGQQQLAAEHRLQQGGRRCALAAQALARPGFGQAGDGADRSRRRLFGGGEPGAGIHPDLVGLFLPGFPLGLAFQQGLYPQHTTGDLEPGEPDPLGVAADLVDTGGKFGGPGGHPGIEPQPFQQLLHPFQPQSRPEIAGEHLPVGHQPGHRGGLQTAGRQILLHGLFLLHGRFLPQLVGGGGEIHHLFPQLGPQLLQQSLAVGAGQVHLVHKQKYRQPVLFQQLPDGAGMALQPVGAADHQHCVVQHLEGALHLAGKVHMSRGVQQGEGGVGEIQQRLLGKNRDAPLFFQGVSVQKGVPVVHPAQFADAAAAVEQPLRKGGFAGVHMGQQPHADALFLPCLFCHKAALLLYIQLIKVYHSRCGQKSGPGPALPPGLGRPLVFIWFWRSAPRGAAGNSLPPTGRR